MGAITAADEWIRSHEVQANFWGSICTIATFVGIVTVWLWRRASLPLGATLAKRLGLRIAQATGIVAFGFLVGWRCGVGAPERKAAFDSRNPAADRPVAEVADDGEKSHENAQNTDDKPLKRRSLYRFSAKPVVCVHNNNPERDIFEYIGNDTYRCRECGITGFLGQSLVDDALVFSEDTARE